MTMLDTPAPVLATKYQQSVADYWNQEKDPVNIRLGEVSGTFHHHYGIGDVDWSVLEGDEATRDERIIKEMHRLEAAQADFLVEQLGALGAGDRILDAGSAAAAPASWPTSGSAARWTASRSPRSR